MYTAHRYSLPPTPFEVLSSEGVLRCFIRHHSSIPQVRCPGGAEDAGDPLRGKLAVSARRQGVRLGVYPTAGGCCRSEAAWLCHWGADLFPEGAYCPPVAPQLGNPGEGIECFLIPLWLRMNSGRLDLEGVLATFRDCAGCFPSGGLSACVGSGFFLVQHANTEAKISCCGNEYI